MGSDWPLGELARPRTAEQVARPAVRLDDRGGTIEVGPLPTAHHRQHPVLRAGLPPRDRGVDEADSSLRSRRMHPPRHLGRRRGVIDEHRTLRHRRQHSTLADGDGNHIGVVADTEHHDVCPLGRSGRGRRRPPRVVDPGIRASAGSVVHGHVVTGRHEMPGHGIAHDPQSDERTLGHGEEPATPDYLRRDGSPHPDPRPRHHRTRRVRFGDCALRSSTRSRRGRHRPPRPTTRPRSSRRGAGDSPGRRRGRPLRTVAQRSHELRGSSKRSAISNSCMTPVDSSSLPAPTRSTNGGATSSPPPPTSQREPGSTPSA